MDHHTHDHRHTHGASGSLDRLAASATLHCLTGCAIGEVLGMVIGTAAGLGNAGTIALQAHDAGSTVYYKNIRIKPLK